MRTACPRIRGGERERAAGLHAAAGVQSGCGRSLKQTDKPGEWYLASANRSENGSGADIDDVVLRAYRGATRQYCAIAALLFGSIQGGVGGLYGLFMR